MAEIYLSLFREKEYSIKFPVTSEQLESWDCACGGKEAALFRLKRKASPWELLSSPISGYCKTFVSTGASPALTRCKRDENQGERVLKIPPGCFQFSQFLSFTFPLNVSHCTLVIHSNVDLQIGRRKTNEFHYFPYLGNSVPEIQLPRFIMPFDLHRVICFPLGRTNSC